MVLIKHLLTLILLGSSTFFYAQIPSLSPCSHLKHDIGNTTITIDFERPAVRGRAIFGGLVPWNKVWRTGAGQCTKIGFNRAVTIGGQTVAAGKYALLSIPNKMEWTIILNLDTTLYGSRDYDMSKDVIRFKVPAKKAGRFHEGLSLELDYVPDNAVLYISWADVEVSFPIITSTEKEANAHIEKILREPPNKEVEYGWPAEYLFYQRTDFNKAIKLLDRQLALEISEYPIRVKFEIYKYLGYRENALEMVQQAYAFLRTKPYDEENIKWSLNEWQKFEKSVSVE